MLNKILEDKEDELKNSPLLNKIYNGYWNLDSKYDNFFLKNIFSKNGILKGNFFFSEIMVDKNNLINLNFAVTFYDGNFYDRNYFKTNLKFNLIGENYTYKQLNYSGTLNFTSYNSNDEISIKISKNTNIKMTIKDKYKKNIDISKNVYDKIFVDIEIKLKDYNMTINFENNNVEFLKCILFIGIQLIFSLISIFTLYNLIKNNEIRLMLCFSLKSFSFNICLDILYICCLLYYSINISVIYFEYFFFLNLFLIFSFLIKLRIIWYAYRQRLINYNININNNRCNKFVIFSLELFVLILIFAFLPHFIIKYPFILLTILIYPIFQISFNVNNNTRTNCFRSKLHFPIFFSSYFFPNYLKGYEYNVFRLTPYPYFFLINMVLFFLIILILILQKLFGPKFFIPKIFLKNYHNYFIKIKKLSKLKIKEKECSICLEYIENKNELEKELIKKKRKNNKNQKIMITPCNHIFHIECLKTWMNQQMKCPNCRKNLPNY